MRVGASRPTVTCPSLFSKWRAMLAGSASPPIVQPGSRTASRSATRFSGAISLGSAAPPKDEGQGKGEGEGEGWGEGQGKGEGEG